jgi:hypothetical protein
MLWSSGEKETGLLTALGTTETLQDGSGSSRKPGLDGGAGDGATQLVTFPASFAP